MEIVPVISLDFHIIKVNYNVSVVSFLKWYAKRGCAMETKHNLPMMQQECAS